ncbi:MAG: metallophosphoesterase [Patescibacteria group bacterium]|jgi:hypothetical protein
MAKRARRRPPKKNKNSFFATLSAIIVATFLFVLVTGAIKWVNGKLTAEGEDLSEETEALQKLEGSNTPVGENTSPVVYTIALMADSEDDISSLQKALEIATQRSVNMIFFLGDYTSWGDISSLEKSKLAMESTGISYLSIPGDHDLADSVQKGDPSGLNNFKMVFGGNYHTLEFGGVKMVLLDNSPNYSKIPGEAMSWFYDQITDADLVFLSQPLYHPTFKRTMGVVDGEETPEVKSQADELLTKIREGNVKAIISADQHLFSRNVDPVDPGLEHIVIGALNSERNLQTPKFCLLRLLEDGSYEIEEVVL